MPEPAPVTLDASDVYDPQLLAQALAADDPVARQLGILGGSPPDVVGDLNEMITGPTSIYSAEAFTGVVLSPQASSLLSEGVGGGSPPDLAALNRAMLESGLPRRAQPCGAGAGRGGPSCSTASR